MVIRGITLEDAESIATSLGVTFQGSDTSGPRKGDECSGVLRPISGGENPYQRTSASGFNDSRRVFAVCWHGHRDFMRAVFELNPDARISSMYATYNGRDHFEGTHRDTGYRNVGSQFYPRAACEVCTCPESGRVDSPVTTFGTLHENGALTDVRTIRQSDLLKCPHVILSADHYRPDGSCRCNDPEEQARLIREYDYTPADFAGVTS